MSTSPSVANTVKCLYCKAYVETKVRSKTRKQMAKSGGLSSIIGAIIESLSTDDYAYSSTLKEVECKFCHRHYVILCDSRDHCCEVLLKNHVFPLNHRPEKAQELKTKAARFGLTREITCDEITGITKDLNEDMINVLLLDGVLVISQNGGATNGEKYILEDIQ
ncbi:MAG: hypothetical protein QXU18_05385 [Thermoplasmatales archaeon]